MESFSIEDDIKNQILCSTKSITTFQEMKELAPHQLDQICEKKFKCECGKSFKQRFNFTRHCRIHTNERNHICPDCGKRFNERGDLIRHCYIHSRERFKFPCMICEKNLTNLHNLQYHMKVKHGIVDDLVCSFCFKLFSDEQSLAVHKESNACGKSFICNTCGKSFSSNFDLERHQRIHTGKKPFICSECGKSFSLKSTLVCHLRTHTGRKPYICNICGKNFSQNGNMHQHLRKKHGNEITSKNWLKNDPTTSMKNIINKSAKIPTTLCDNSLFKKAREMHESQESTKREVLVNTMCIKPKFNGITETVLSDARDASSVLNSDYVEHESNNTVKSNQVHSLIPCTSDVQKSENSASIFIFITNSEKQNKSSHVSMACEKTFIQNSISFDRIKFMPEILSKVESGSNKENSCKEKDGHDFQKPIVSNTSDVISIESGNFMTNCTNFSKFSLYTGHKKLLKKNQSSLPETAHANLKQLPKNENEQHDKVFSIEEQPIFITDGAPELSSNETLSNSFQSKHYLDFPKSLVKITSKPFLCPVCSKTFSKLGNLKEHLYCHNDKPFHCNVCDFRCHSPRTHKNHTKIHSTNRHIFNCLDCSLGFYTQTDLIRHNRIHTGEKPFQCAICGRCFSLKSSLVIHERVHTGEKPYICPLCQKTFAQNSNMKQHLKRHCKQNSNENE